MEQLKHMKETLTSCVQAQISGHMDQVDAQELGAAVDMIKDLAEAIYYCTITEAMEEQEEEGEKHGGKGKHGMMYYDPMKTPMYHYPYPIEYYDPRYRERYNPNYSMYAQGDGGSSSSSNGGSGRSSGGNNARGGGSRGYHEGMIDHEYPMYNMMYEQGGSGSRNYPSQEMIRDPKEGRSGQRRKMYMEGKYMGKEKSKQMQELEGYMQELTADLTEMIQDASPEEKQLLQQKISTLATKIK